jgi:hypothetical protein
MPRRPQSGGDPRVAALIALQRSVGNRAVGRLVQRCPACSYELIRQEMQKKGIPYDPSDLTLDPDHGFEKGSEDDREVQVGKLMNEQTAGLDLWRPPALGQGDYVAVKGKGHHIDLKGLHTGKAADTLNQVRTKNEKSGLKLYMAIDTGVDSGLPQTDVEAFHKALKELDADVQRRVFYVGPLRPTEVAMLGGEPYRVPPELCQPAPKVEDDEGLGLPFE